MVVIMNRRTFLKTVIAAGALGFSGSISLLGKSKVGRKFLQAVRSKKYPGKIKPLGELTESKKLLG